MFPLQVIMVQCGESIRGHVRRELGNQLAWVKCEYRDVSSIVDQQSQVEDEGNLLFVMHVRSSEDLQHLQRLSTAFPGRPILALRDRDSDMSLFLRALRSGATFAIPVPLDAEDLRTALNWIVRQLGMVPRETKVVGVMGVTGGSGATSIALNLAYEISTTCNRHCLLAELALHMGMLSTYLHLEPRCSMHHVLQEMDHLDIDFLRQALTSVGDRLAVLCGPQQAIHSPGVAPDDVRRLLFYARALADVVVVDVPCTYDDLCFETLACADHIVLLWEQKLPSVRALQMVRDALHLRQVNASRQTLVINRYDPRLPGFAVGDLEKLLQRKSLQTIANDWTGMSEAINEGRPLRLQAPKSRALPDIAGLAESLVRPRKAASSRNTRRTPGPFSRLVRAFGLSS